MMKPYGVVIVLSFLLFLKQSRAQCDNGRTITFTRWSGVSPEGATPVFMYVASGEEDSLVGTCLARCRELDDCAAVVVVYSKGNCHGIADSTKALLKVDNDVAYFKKVCLSVPEDCGRRWWAVENTPGYHLHSEGLHQKVILNTTVYECYDAVFNLHGDRMYRSAQWVVPQGAFDAERISTSDAMIGNCILNAESRFTEPESYRVSNYYTFYIENQCLHDYPKKIDRCSYEEYYNQTLKHVEYTSKNNTKDECKKSCEQTDSFICRGFTWIPDGPVNDGGERGLCDLHSEDLVSTGSWLLRKTSNANYYRRVICLNISVDCEGTNMLVTYHPRGTFRGRVYVPGRGERCEARAVGHTVRLVLPLYGDCDVHFAYGISQGPNGVINRTMAFVMVMVQNNPIIQTAGDRWVRVGCSPGARTATQVDTTVAVREIGGYKRPSSENSVEPSLPAVSASAVLSSAAPLTMYVVRDSGDNVGAVSLGEPLQLRIETTDTSEIKAYHLVASSRLGDSSVLLLDSRGCPTGQVDFPAFTRSWLGGTQRLSARFKAFRFPTSHVVRFAIMVKYCDQKCSPVECNPKQGRTARQSNDTLYQWADETPATVSEDSDTVERPPAPAVVAQSGPAPCSPASVPRADVDAHPLELEMLVDSKDIMSADTLVRADHRSTSPYESTASVPDGASSALVCVHELLLVALALAWLAVQLLLLLACCVLVKKYRNLAEMNMQKEYQSFDNVGFDTVSTHRRVHWPDQTIDILHTT